MSNKNKLLKKRLNYNKMKLSTDFERYYGNEKRYGEAIIKEQDLKEDVIKLEKQKKRFSELKYLEKIEEKE